MTLVYLVLTTGAAFVIGYLLGDRRGVREANEVLAHNNRVLLEAMSESVKGHVEGEDEAPRPALH